MLLHQRTEERPDESGVPSGPGRQECPMPLSFRGPSILHGLWGRMVSCARPRGYPGQPALVGLFTGDPGGLPTRRRLPTTSVQIRFLEKPIWTAKHRRFSQAAADNAFKAPPARRSMLSCLRNGAPLTRPQFGQHLMERANLLFRFGRSLRGIKDLGCPIAVVPRQFGQQWLPTCPTTSVEFPFLGKLSGIGQECLRYPTATTVIWPGP